ncbi:relaxase MobL [Tetragenococcus koreensis]|uniref:MobP2 family relaxase n=1 Tax=Tetragenococcus TaxID=51668 RepID=UPI001F164CBE|nr:MULTISPECIES: MobP2 family relaxase [Tetragenococcus]MDN6640986.1 relaxase MobL [Tetragenococcus sp.]MCF1585713.1 relaxase MobL [Tetragenococcus koreensis]MCF1615346.1 relaxase MobL [Tetragenococcus koreensis]MCF1625143.1 relaxase MobL [Tetragenococcus koreensis]MCF1629979.1 relaxase MobL [Tetragenococcus koreensis]
MIQAAIVVKWRFTMAGQQKFQKYIDYVDRKEAIRNQHFHQFNVVKTDGYNEYMEDPKKSSGLFTKYKNQISDEDRKRIKKIFQQAQKNDSLMWQDVVSFDTQWLIQQQLFDNKNEKLNEGKIITAIRVAMEEQLQAENLANSAFWTGAIHYNEKHHIHVHIATIEATPTREYKTFNRKDGTAYLARKGYRSKQNVDRFKRRVVSQLLDRDESLAQVSNLIRQQITQPHAMNQLPDNELKYLYHKIFQQLPKDQRKWKYNMNALDSVRPLMVRFIHTYLMTYEKEDYQKLQELLKENVSFYKQIYGKGAKEYRRAQNFSVNKNEEVYTRLGNALLREMRELANEQMKVDIKGETLGNPGILREMKGWRSTHLDSRIDLGKIKKAFQKDFKSIKNQQVYLKNLQQTTNSQNELQY